MEFHEQLIEVMSHTSANGPKLVFGDFNSRLGEARPGEDSVVGPRSLGRQASHQVEMPNRDFLLAFCAVHGMGIANTFCDVPIDKNVTYHEPEVPPMTPITFTSLVPQVDVNSMCHAYRDRLETLASSHFPVVAKFQVDAALRNPIRNNVSRKDWSALQDPDVHA